MKKDKLYISWEDYGIWIDYVIKSILKSKRKFKNVYGVPRNGLIFAVAISHQLEIPLILDKNLITDKTLIVDSITDTGKTMKEYKEENIAVIFKNKHCQIKPKFWGLLIDRWVQYSWEKDENA